MWLPFHTFLSYWGPVFLIRFLAYIPKAGSCDLQSVQSMEVVPHSTAQDVSYVDFSSVLVYFCRITDCKLYLSCHGYHKQKKMYFSWIKYGMYGVRRDAAATSPTYLCGVISTHCDAGVAIRSRSVHKKYHVFEVSQTQKMKEACRNNGVLTEYRHCTVCSKSVLLSFCPGLTFQLREQAMLSKNKQSAQVVPVLN